jgi:hypothetical protein
MSSFNFRFGQNRPQGENKKSGHPDDRYYDNEPRFTQTRPPQFVTPPREEGPRFDPRMEENRAYEQQPDNRFSNNRQQERNDYVPDAEVVSQNRQPRMQQQMRGYAPQRSGQQDLRDLSFWQDDESQDNSPEDFEDERSSPLKFFVFIACLVGLSAFGWFVYRWASNPSMDNPPLIQAEAGPFKVRPENPGGMTIPHQDKLIYGRLVPGASEPAERLLPPTNQLQPVPYQQDPQYQDPQYAPQQQYAMPQNQQQPGYQQQQPLPQQPEMMPQNPAAMQQQGGMIAQPNNGGYNPSYAPQQQPQVQPQAQAAYPNYNIAQQPVDPRMVVPQQPETVPVKKVEAAPKVESKLATKTAPLKGGFYAQLASLGTNELATKEWDRLKKKHPQDLGKYSPDIRAIDLGGNKGKTYGIRIGPFESRNDVLKKCRALGVGCVVVSN